MDFNNHATKQLNVVGNCNFICSVEQKMKTQIDFNLNHYIQI